MERLIIVKRSWLLMLMAGVLIAADATKANPPTDAAREGLAQLQGTWVVESRYAQANDDGKETKRAKSMEWKVVIEGAKWTDVIKGKPSPSNSIRIDPGTTPKTIEFTITTRSGRTIVHKGVY